MSYILEVQQFVIDGDKIHPDWNGKKHHIGYMNKIFKTKTGASHYYHENNQHMRHITAEYNWCSDWDPKTKLVYVVRRYTGEFLQISPFV
jgi:hypothetical protein